jgi:hypothetical protein
MHRIILAAMLMLGACVGDSSTPVDSGTDTSTGSDATTDVVGADQSTKDAGPDASPTDASDAADTGPTCDAAITSSFTCAGGQPVGCYDFATSAHQCMASSNACLNSSYTTPIVAGCFATSDCKSATPYCCVGTVVVQTTGCPGALSISANGGMTCSSTDCSGLSGQAALCDTKAPCPNGHACIPVKVAQPPGLQGQIFGVCAP